MNKITVTTKIETPFHSGAAVYLTLPDEEPVKLSFNIEAYARIRGAFDQTAGELAYFCAIIYGCDRLIQRDNRDGDRWSREIAVDIPVADPAHWNACRETAEKMLEFLTGDLWRLSFSTRLTPLFGVKFNETRRKFRSRRQAKGTAVSLFSGGLDSLTGAIDWLEENPNESLVLASSYDAHAENAKDDQKRLLPKLVSRYPGRVTQFIARSGLLTKGNDGNFRSRSLTFLGNGVLAASFVGEGTKIAIPENGAIALNYPLSSARSGSFSTRTVHPFFIEQFNVFISELGFNHKIENRYQFKTKGEILQECQNQSALEYLFSDSVSCGKRGRKMYWNDRHSLACGYCVPCVFRQAAVHASGFASESYGCSVSRRDEWGQLDLLKPNSDLQTVIDFVEADLNEETIWLKLRSNGYLKSELKEDYVNLVTRLRAELRVWLSTVNLG